MDPEGGIPSTESIKNSPQGRQDDNDNEMVPYANWVSEVAASSQPAVPDPPPENVIRIMGQVFQNEMLLENILEQIIWCDDRATVRACRLVSKQWVCALAKLYKKLKKPQFIVSSCKDNIPMEPRMRPLLEHTFLYDFTKTMLRNDRLEGFIPTFSLKLGPTYFRKSSYSDFVSCLIQCSASLVELYLRFPKNSSMSFLLPPGVAFPNLNTLGVAFTNQALLPQPLQGVYHFHAEFYPNHCGIHLVQTLLNAAPRLRRFHFLHGLVPTNPPDLENLYLPETLTSIRVETPLREFDLLLRRNFPCLTELVLNATVALYSEEQLFELFTKLGSTLKHVWLQGPHQGLGPRPPLTIRLPRMENVIKFVIFKPWEFERRASPTLFDDAFPNLKTLVFANQTEQNFRYLMNGMRSTSVTSFSLWLGSSRPEPSRDLPAFPIPLQLEILEVGDNPHMDNERLRIRLRQIIDAQAQAPLHGIIPGNFPHPDVLRERLIEDALRQPNLGPDDLLRRAQRILRPRRAGGPGAAGIHRHQHNPPAPAPQLGRGAPPQLGDGAPPLPPQVVRRGRNRNELRRRVREPNENPEAINQNNPANGNPMHNVNGAEQHQHIDRIRARLEEAYRGFRRADPPAQRDLPFVILEGRQPRYVEGPDNVFVLDVGFNHHQQLPRDLLERERELGFIADAPAERLVEHPDVDLRQLQQGADAARELEVDNAIPVANAIIGQRINEEDEGREGGDNQADVLEENDRNDPAERGPPEMHPHRAAVEIVNGDVQPEPNEVAVINVMNNGDINAGEANVNGRVVGPNVDVNLAPGPAGRPPGQRNPQNNEPHAQVPHVHPAPRQPHPHHHHPQARLRPPFPLPYRPVAMTKDKLQTINLAFPNLVKLTLNISGPGICGMKYIFQEMCSLQNLRITVENSLWPINWDSLLTGIAPDFCEAVRTNAQLWDEVYMPENHTSIRSMTNLKELCLLECLKPNEAQSASERCISDVAFHFALLKMKTLKHLIVTAGFSPSPTMARKWHEEKGYFVKVDMKPRLDSKFYQNDLRD